MPVNLTTLAGKLARTEVEFMGHKTPVTYDPMVLTAANIDRMQTGKDEDFFDVFTSLVKAWDVKRGTTKVGITPKNLKEIPLPFLQAVFQSIMRDSGGGVEVEGKNSSDG